MVFPHTIFAIRIVYEVTTWPTNKVSTYYNQARLLSDWYFNVDFLTWNLHNKL